MSRCLVQPAYNQKWRKGWLFSDNSEDNEHRKWQGIRCTHCKKNKAKEDLMSLAEGLLDIRDRQQGRLVR